MKLHYYKLASIIFLLLAITVSAEEPAQRFKLVVDRMVDAINKEDYPSIQKDFGKVMLDYFPLEKSKPFFKNLMNNCGKIKKLDAPRIVPPNQAIFPAYFEKAVLDIKIVLDNQNKIIGLMFLPHTSGIPVPDKHSIVLRLPFEGQWIVLWGGDTKELNQHHGVPIQNYAFDFLCVDKNGKPHKDNGKKNEDYFAFGKKVLAPADGVVTDVIRGIRDNTPGSMNPYSALGNAVIIKHQKHEVSVLAHFKQNSIRVKVGDKVKKGQILGLCGNSGNSSEAHIHYHLQNTPIVQNGTGIKCIFTDVIVTKSGKVRTEEKYSPIKNDIVKKNRISPTK
jgi:peptidase M23-like protein/uncharacterized protein DUF3887